MSSAALQSGSPPSATASTSVLSGPEKAAVLLLSFGSEESAKLISGLSPREAELLAGKLPRAQQVDEETRWRVIEEFRHAAARQSAPPADTSAGQRSPDEFPIPSRAGYPKASEATSSRSSADQTGAPDDGEEHAGRPYDFSRLERVPPRPPAEHPLDVRADLSLLGDLPVRCRVELAAILLPLTDLRDLRVGDVVLLRPASEPGVELVGGDRCRFPCRLLSQGRHRAVEVLADAAKGERQL